MQYALLSPRFVSLSGQPLLTTWEAPALARWSMLYLFLFFSKLCPVCSATTKEEEKGNRRLAAACGLFQPANRPTANLLTIPLDCAMQQFHITSIVISRDRLTFLQRCLVIQLYQRSWNVTIHLAHLLPTRIPIEISFLDLPRPSTSFTSPTERHHPLVGVHASALHLESSQALFNVTVGRQPTG